MLHGHGHMGILKVTQNLLFNPSSGMWDCVSFAHRFGWWVWGCRKLSKLLDSGMDWYTSCPRSSWLLIFGKLRHNAISCERISQRSIGVYLGMLNKFSLKSILAWACILFMPSFRASMAPWALTLASNANMVRIAKVDFLRYGKYWKVGRGSPVRGQARW